MKQMRPFSPESSRLTDLLLDRALQGLQADESAELRALVDDADTAEPTFDPAGFEQAAALAAIALIGHAESLPAAMHARLRATDSHHQHPSAASPTLDAEQSKQAPALPARGTSSPWRLMGGWLAAAACLAIATLAWLPKLAPKPDAVALRARLLEERPDDLVQWTWSAGNDPRNSAVSGDVVWSDSRQQGYLRFKGLARNDPSREQYQLWIFDANRKPEYPVDGGVFDVAGDDEVVIAIDPKLRVFNASMFAVTVEQPGGVARSDRERIPALAQPPA